MGSCTSCIRPTLPEADAATPASEVSRPPPPASTKTVSEGVKVEKAKTLSGEMFSMVQEVGGEAVVEEDEKLHRTADLYVVPFTALAEGLEASAHRRELLDWGAWPKDRVIGMVSHPWKHEQGEVLKAAVAGVKAFCAKHKVEEQDVYLFANWLSIDQVEESAAKWEAVSSLPAFLSQMRFFLVPIVSGVKVDDPKHGHLSWNYYLRFGGARLELLVAMKLAAMGLPIRSYFFDVSKPDTKLTEIAPYAPGVMAPSPTAPEAMWECCDRAGGAGRPHECDRVRVGAAERSFAALTERFSTHNRLRLIKSHEVFEIKGKASNLWDTIRAVPFEAFRKHGRIPRSSDGIAVSIPDGELVGKRIMYIAHKWWRKGSGDEGGAHPDTANNVKHAWICAAAEHCLAQDDFPASRLYVWIDYACFDQDEARKPYYYTINVTPVLARCSYHVALLSPPPFQGMCSFDVPEKLRDGEKFWNSAWNRFEAFHACVLSASGVLTSVFESTIPTGTKFEAAHMVVKPVECRALARLENKKAYVQSSDMLNPVRGAVPGDKEARILLDWVTVFCEMVKRNKVNQAALCREIVAEGGLGFVVGRGM